MKKLGRDFFERKPELVARELLGKFLVRKIRSKTYVGKIVETEAYLSENDLACHASRGKTKRNEVMFGPAGHAYIYFTYGMHWMLNFVTEKEGKPSAVLVRALEPLSENSKQLSDNNQINLKKLGSGPARLTKWMEIDGYLNEMDISNSEELFVAGREKVKNSDVVRTSRIGVDCAGEHKDLPLRFYIKASKFISKS